MKKRIVLSLILSILFIIPGCGQSAQTANNDSTTGQSVENAGTDTDTSESDVTRTENADSDLTEPDTSTPETSNTETAIQPKEIYIDFRNIEACFNASAEEASPLTLSVVSEVNTNRFVEDWILENDLFLPMLGNEWAAYVDQKSMPVVTDAINLENNVFYDDNYIYEWNASTLNIYNKKAEQLLYTISYDTTTRWNMMGNCAYVRDGILYMGYISNGYAMPGTCYLLAYDLEKETVLWRSEDQTYNSRNFIVKDDVIICGYGFTDENDYIYQIDMHTGKVITKTEVKKMPDLFIEKDDQLYMFAYSYEYIFDLE